jgi:exodeoxyribonuclease VII small subunit
MSDAAMTDDEIAAMSFEQALARLEAIVNELETGKAELERSIDLYQLGARLKAHCQARLDAAQLKVERIVMGPNGPTGTASANFS